ncbi:MAG: hypothetical protein VX278_00020, partial [Myxococcota bacterium]|nr:hypothetical protein [Myxococcota bacterium]
LAHEAGHYLGLFHPHEVDYRSWDALEDTPDCEGSGVCDTSLQGNLMYPYPICSVSSCRPQEELTTDQTGVMHRYVGVD